MKTIILIILPAFLLVFSIKTFAQISIKEKPADAAVSSLNPTKDLVVNIGNSKDHTTLMAAVKAADMVEILQSVGPFTLFAPTNAAFDLLPTGTVAALLKTENKGNLNIILKYHIVPGRLSAADMIKLVEGGNGSASLTTLGGKNLIISLDGNRLIVKDEKGGTAVISVRDQNQSNGVMHIIDHVLLPKEL